MRTRRCSSRSERQSGPREIISDLIHETTAIAETKGVMTAVAGGRLGSVVEIEAEAEVISALGFGSA